MITRIITGVIGIALAAFIIQTGGTLFAGFALALSLIAWFEYARAFSERGMALTGGGALLRDLDRKKKKETSLQVIVAEDPLNCVVRGCGRALENMDKLQTIFTSD